MNLKSKVVIMSITLKVIIIKVLIMITMTIRMDITQIMHILQNHGITEPLRLGSGHMEAPPLINPRGHVTILSHKNHTEHQLRARLGRSRCLVIVVRSL